ncbi:unnamed protein product [Ixodes pacificus]
MEQSGAAPQSDLLPAVHALRALLRGALLRLLSHPEQGHYSQTHHAGCGLAVRPGVRAGGSPGSVPVPGGLRRGQRLDGLLRSHAQDRLVRGRRLAHRCLRAGTRRAFKRDAFLEGPGASQHSFVPHLPDSSSGRLRPRRHYQGNRQPRSLHHVLQFPRPCDHFRWIGVRGSRRGGAALRFPQGYRVAAKLVHDDDGPPTVLPHVERQGARTAHGMRAGTEWRRQAAAAGLGLAYQDVATTSSDIVWCLLLSHAPYVH